MQIEILARPAASAARIHLHRNEVVTAEVGSMISMTSRMHVQTTSRSVSRGGGILKGIKRVFAGENFFLNHFEAQDDNQELILAPILIGDVTYHRLRGGSLIVSGTSWLANTGPIEVDTTWQGIGAAVLSGESMFWIRCHGEGEVLLNSFGAIYEIDVNGQYTVDTGHIVAFEDTLQFRMGKASASWVGSFLGGEGLVCKFSGQGKLYCQTHNPPSFGNELGPKLKPRQN